MALTSKRRTFGAISLGSGVLLAIAGLFAPPAGADTIYNEADFDAHLAEQHHGAVASDVENRTDCPRPAGHENDTVWHLILNSNDNFDELWVTFESEGEVHYTAGDFGPPDDSHAYVYTHGSDDVLLDGVANVEGDETTFVLSHVCVGSQTTTTTAGDTTTTAGDTTTTEETTTTEASTTTEDTVQNTVITTGGANTTTDETVKGVVQERQLPRTGSSTLPLLEIGIGLILTGLGALRYGQHAAVRVNS